MLDHPFSEGIFPNVESKPPLAQLDPISVCPFLSYLRQWHTTLSLWHHEESQSARLHMVLQGKTEYLNIRDLVLCMLVEMCELMNEISSVSKFNCSCLSKISCWDLLCCCYSAAALFLTKYLCISVKKPAPHQPRPTVFFPVSKYPRAGNIWYYCNTDDFMSITSDFWRHS